MKNKYGFKNGDVLPVEDICISPYDLGLTRGYAVFDFLRTYNSIPFHLEEHLDRFFTSMEYLHLQTHYTKEQITEIILELINRNEFEESNVRIIGTGGVSVNAKNLSTPTLIILVDEAHFLPVEMYEKGIEIKSFSFMRDHPAIKTNNYLFALKTWHEQPDLVEILYAPDGNVLETGTSNIMAFFGNTLVTPHNDILPGITKNIVLDLVKTHFQIEQRAMTLDELLTADEVFLTASNKEILPVRKIDEHIIADGNPGKNTLQLLEMYRKHIETQCNFTYGRQ